jgi:hypothetical protein
VPTATLLAAQPPARPRKKGRDILKITLEIGMAESVERRADVRIRAGELSAVHLHLATPHQRNRTGLYMRRHTLGRGRSVTPNEPLRAPEEPAKLTIPEHVEALRQMGVIRRPSACQALGKEIFAEEPAMLAVPVSDVVANLMRPAFHRNGLGPYRLFFFEGEPIEHRIYWCACLVEGERGQSRLELRWLRFDPATDRVLGEDGRDLLKDGLVWAVALVPLVIDGSPLDAVTIAQHDYDLRQVLGRDAEAAIQYAYDGFGDGRWNTRVAEVVSAHKRSARPFATFYHSLLALDREGNVLIRQVEGALPGLAIDLTAEGIVSAGLLDSGGSCSLYDVWLESYLNHSWYFREPRGAILVFELTPTQRLPQDKPGVWIQRRRSV